ncbi:hypothetical protein N9P38_01740 [Flavobacteriales bacterium]|nr:hypothetical protein [Flavobacteriales bacterium]
MSDKKITKVASTESTDKKGDSWKPTEDNKSKATTFRAIAIAAWVIAIGFEIWGIMKLKTVKEDGMTFLIVLIVAALIFAVAGNLLWKKANRLDPAKKSDKFRFFVQNQLGAIISAIAFLPLVIMILMNKDIDGKQKGILGAIAGAALLIGVGTGIDFNPPSVEQYTAETERIEALTGSDQIFWTKSGKKYHIFQDCGYINGDRTSEIFQGTVGDAKAMKKISELCSRCEGQAEKENNAKMLDLGGEEDEDEDEELEAAE